MNEIVSIEVRHDPLSPEQKRFILSMDDVRTFNESFYTVGFNAEILISGSDSASIFSFKKVKNHAWEFCEVNDEVDEDVLPGDNKQYIGTFENALIHLLTELEDEEYRRESVKILSETPGLREMILEEIPEMKANKQPIMDTNVKKPQWGKIILTIIVLIIWAISCSRMCSGPDWGWDSF
jgi:hypothetical protein